MLKKNLIYFDGNSLGKLPLTVIKNLNKFLKVGIPNRNLENWKFSDLSQITFVNVKLESSLPFVVSLIIL